MLSAPTASRRCSSEKVRARDAGLQDRLPQPPSRAGWLSGPDLSFRLSLVSQDVCWVQFGDSQRLHYASVTVFAKQVTVSERGCGRGRKKISHKRHKKHKRKTTDLDLPFVLFVRFVANLLPSPGLIFI